MAKRKLKCPECNHEWEYGYWEWVWKAPFHTFTKRLTKCPKCGKRSYIKGEKSK